MTSEFYKYRKEGVEMRKNLIATVGIVTLLAFGCIGCGENAKKEENTRQKAHQEQEKDKHETSNKKEKDIEEKSDKSGTDELVENLANEDEEAKTEAEVKECILSFCDALDGGKTMGKIIIDYQVEKGEGVLDNDLAYDQMVIVAYTQILLNSTDVGYDAYVGTFDNMEKTYNSIFEMKVKNDVDMTKYYKILETVYDDYCIIYNTTVNPESMDMLYDAQTVCENFDTDMERLRSICE